MSNRTLYAKFDGIQNPIMLQVSSVGQSKLDIRRYTQNPENRVTDVDDSREINRVVYALRDAKTDNYTSIAKNQPLVMASKVSLDTMRKVLEEYSNRLQRKYFIWAELVDLKPQLRDPNFRLPRGKNAVLYRGPWRVGKDGNIDLVDVDPENEIIPVTVPSGQQLINREWVEVTGGSENTYTFPPPIHPSASRMINVGRHTNYVELYNITWDFKTPRRQAMPYNIFMPYSLFPEKGFDDLGPIFASRLSIEELVEDFELF